MKKVLFPGSFDPITKGHMHIISQASDIFDEVYIGVLQNLSKSSFFFTIEERLEMIKQLYENDDRIKVVTGRKAVSVASEYGCQYIIRGLRNTIDFEYEKNIAEINQDISKNQINTICLFADSTLSSVSSSTVRELFQLEEEIDKYVDFGVKEKMLRKRREKLWN